MAYTIIRFGSDYSGATGEVVGDVIGARTSTAVGYPYTLGGVTMGLASSTAIVVNTASGWQAGDALPLRGRFRVANPAARGFRIEVIPGEYRMILGVAANNYQDSRWRVNDGIGIGATNRLDFEVSGVTAFGSHTPANLNQWHDHLGVVRAIGVGTSPRVPVNVLSATPTLMQFSTGIIEVLNGEYSPSPFSSDLSFIAFERVTVPLVQDDFRIVPGSLPAEPVVGTPYTFQVEAIDTTQGNARVTTFQSASVAVGIDVELPDGLVVFSGDFDEPMVDGLASFTLTFTNGLAGILRRRRR
jgi:hypothetical protein